MNSYSSFNIITRNSGPDINSISYVNTLAKNVVVDICGGTSFSNLAGISSYSINARGINPGNQGNTYLGIKNSGGNVLQTSNFATTSSNSFTFYVKSASRFNTNPILGHGYALTTNALSGGYVIGNTLTISYYTLFPQSSTYTISGTVVSSDFSGSPAITSIPYTANITSNMLLTYNFQNTTTKTLTFSIANAITSLQLINAYTTFTGTNLTTPLETVLIKNSPTTGNTSVSLYKGINQSFFSDTTRYVIFDPSVNLTNTDYAFYNTQSLNYITLPSNLKTIGRFMFYSSAIRNISIPNGVTSIGDFSFRSTNIRSINLPISLQVIGVGPFQGTLLTSVTIPDTVTSIEYLAFSYCLNLTSITLSTNLRSISDGLLWYSTNIKSLTIPYGVTSIGNNVVRGLSSFSIPTTVTTIGEGFFWECKVPTIDLSYLTNLMSIGGSSFDSATSTSIILPQSVTSIGTSSTFYNCGNLTSVTLGNITMSQLPTDSFGSSSTLLPIATINTYRPHNYNGTGLRSGNLVSINRWNGSSFGFIGTYYGQSSI